MTSRVTVQQATVVLPGAKRESKLSSNTEAGVFVGYSLDRTAYRVLLDSSIVEARSVYFDESKFPFMKSDKDLSINGTGVGFSVGSGSGSMSGSCFDSKGSGLGSNVRVNSIASSDSSSGSSFGSHRSLPASSSGSGSGSICALPSPSPSSSPSHSPSPPPPSSSSIIVHKPRSVRRILSTPSAPLESPTLPTLPSIPSVPSLPSSPILPPSDHDVSISPDSSPIVSSSEYIPSQLDLSEAGPSINESDISGDSGISQRGGDIGFQPSIIASSPTPPPSVELEVVPLSQESPSSDLVNSLDQAGVSVVTKDDTQAVLPKSRSRVVAVRLPSITPAKRPSSDDIVSPPSKHLCENSLKQSPVSATPAKRPAEEECISYRRLKSPALKAMSSEEAEFWLEACVIEMSSLKRNGTWELVDLPPGRKAINSKWVFKVKRKADGSIERYKARLVCIGFSQVEGIDYTETFAPVVRYETVRIVLAIAAQFGFQVHHMDVETAFLNGDLKEDIYMRQPKGFVVKGQESKVCHLKKSLYGLKQAPLCWNEKIHGALVKLGFIRNESDYGVYTKGSGSTMVIIALYVDDLLISGNSSEVIAKTKSSLSSMFKMKDLGPVEQFLGMRVKQSPYHITVDVSRYIFDVLEEFGMQNCSSVKTPLPTRDLSDFSESDSATDASMYRSIIGKLIYAANCARPDLAVAVSFLCRYMQSPKSIHMEAAKHTLRYLKGTAELGLEYRAQKVYKLVGYSDADYAQDKQDRKSFTGPASSSVESEYMSLSDASKECFWINQLLSLCKIPVPLPVTMFEDNQGCIALAQNPVFHRRTKHIDVRYHVVRHYIRSGVIHLEYLDTQVMLADMFTKNLGRVKFETLRGLLGMKAVGDSATRGGVEHAMLSQTSAVDNARILPTDDKVKAIRDFPVPITPHDCMRFMGLANFYRRFVPHFSQIAAPLTTFMSQPKDTKWTPVEQKAFDKLKDKLTTSPVLIIPNPDDLFVLTTDASKIGIGATLEQFGVQGKKLGVVAYFSRKLDKAQQNYAVQDLEFLAIVEALKHFRTLLYGVHFILRTDHISLTHLQSQTKQPTGRIARWFGLLAEYDFSIQYIKGKTNVAADALSRMFIEAIELDNDFEELLQQVRDSLKSDPFFADIISHLEDSDSPLHDRLKKQFEYDDGVLYFIKFTTMDDHHRRLCIPASQLRQLLISKAHNLSHSGPYATYLTLAADYYWPHMFRNIKRFIQSCDNCLHNKPEQRKTQGLLQPLEVPENRWSSVSMDFITGIPMSEDFDMILVVVDRLTKRAHFIATTTTLDGPKLAQLFMREVTRLHGYPTEIVSDRDVRFSTFWTAFTKSWGTKLCKSTAYHPQSDGQTERINRILRQLLRSYCYDNGLDWFYYLDQVEFAYNSAPQSTIKTSPFVADLGFLPRQPAMIRPPLDARIPSNVESLQVKLKAILLRTQEYMSFSQLSQQRQADKHRRPVEIKVGDSVLIHHTSFQSPSNRMLPLFVGPYTAVKAIGGGNAFELDLPTTVKNNRVFNVSKLRKYVKSDEYPADIRPTEDYVKKNSNRIASVAAMQNGLVYLQFTDSLPGHCVAISTSFWNSMPAEKRIPLFKAYMARIKARDELL
ncbi:uncharacterized protein SAPINGB_P006194 [Magnusiomyces paraingens]|uniref:Integrase catalytic domain-containing protein n=1 Tax=Magnusiomyces paraingens TaxID=2606893 RepID=A0A5E8C3R2_9ASCO|nr:uncharacterized protein SAPINGB_P006194 [Saprochaete ingens]VVT58414.1 unnamed protein product [Saprochaete ingens]